MPLGGGVSRVGPRNHVLNGDQDRTNLFAAATDNKTVMRTFVKLLWTVVL